MPLDPEQIEKLSSSLGLTGEGLAKYLREVDEREERASNRELEKQRIELQIAENQIKLKEAENEQLRLTQARPQSSNQNLSRENVKFPPLTDNDDITDYLIRYERVSLLKGWTPHERALNLGTLLQGRALSIYSNLDDDTAKDYALLKASLMQAFRKTDDFYRRDFRHAKPNGSETYAQFVIGLSRKFTFWTNSAGVLDYESLANLMIEDQFLSAISPELRTFLKERDAHGLESIAKLADTYSTAHAKLKPVVKTKIERQEKIERPEKIF